MIPSFPHNMGQRAVRVWLSSTITHSIEWWDACCDKQIPGTSGMLGQWVWKIWSSSSLGVTVHWIKRWRGTIKFVPGKKKWRSGHENGWLSWKQRQHGKDDKSVVARYKGVWVVWDAIWHRQNRMGSQIQIQKKMSEDGDRRQAFGPSNDSVGKTDPTGCLALLLK